MMPVIALMILTHSAYSGTRLALSLTALEWHVSTALIGVLLSLISLIPMLVSLVVGRWIDRVGTFKPLAIGNALLLIGAALPWMVPSIPILFLSSALTGSGFLLCHMSGQQMTGMMASGAERTRNFGWLAVGFSVSGFAGPMIAGFAIDYLGHLWAFAATAILCLFALLLARYWQVQLRLSSRPPACAPAIVSAVIATTAEPLCDEELKPQVRGLALLRHPDLSRLYLCVVLISSAWDVHQFLVPIHATKLGLSASQIGLIMGAFAFATLLVRLSLHKVSGLMSHWSVLACVLFICSFSYAVYPFLPGAVAMMMVSFILGIGLGCGQPIVMAALYELSPKGQAGEAAGLRQSLINATQTALPMLFGSAGSILSALTTFTGIAFKGSAFAPLFWVFSATALLGGISTMRYSKKAQRDALNA